MKHIVLLIASFSFLIASIIHVPEEINNIQQAINISNDGDTVLVSQGIYFENILIDKKITLTSYAIFDDLSEWVEWDVTNEFYEVTNPNILNTIIDGGSITLADQFGSCIRIISPAGECVQPTVYGFTLTNGKGSRGRIGSNDDSREEREVRVGGGLFVHKSSPKINYNRIINNKSEQDSVEGSRYSSGGGTGYYDDIGIDDIFRESINECDENEVLDYAHNLYRDNTSDAGRMIGSDTNRNIDLRGSYFDVYACEDNSEMSMLWINNESDSGEFDDSNSDGNMCLIAHDVWVNSNGSDENSGTTSDPFLTIRHALEMIGPSDENPITIYLQEGTYSPSITGEEFPLMLISNATLSGESHLEAQTTIIDAESTNQVITINGVNNVELNMLTITGGETNNYGGGVSCSNSSISMFLTFVKNNSAYEGGGIYLENSNGNFAEFVIMENSSLGNGGGILARNNSILSIDGGSLSNNSAHSGGGLALDWNSNAEVIDIFYIEGNNASANGGGVFCTYNSSFFTSESPSMSYNLIIDNNIAYAGGGIYAEFESNIDLNDVTIDNNIATYNGGALYIDSGSNVDITLGIFINNSAYEGGAIFAWLANMDLQFSTIRDNSAEVNGGGIYLYDTNGATLSGIDCFDNSAYSGGGYYLHNDVNTILTNSSAFSNTTTQNGAGLYSYNSENLLIDDAFVSSNSSLYNNGDGDGGGIYFFYTDGVELNNSRIVGNNANQGGGIYSYVSDITMNNVEISGNSSVINGGGYFCYYTTANIYDGIIDENISNFNGGGIYAYEATLNFINGSLSNNSAEQSGGGAYYYYSHNSQLENIDIIANNANYKGGALYYDYNQGISHYGNVIADNTSEIGAGIHLYYTEPIIANSTFVNNIATSGGGAIDAYQATPNIINSIIWGNSPIQIDPGYLGTINLAFSDIQGGWNGDGNIDVTPELNDDYSLSNTSPCIDAGIAYYQFEEDVIFSLAENDYNGSAPDMGAIEFEQLIIGDVNFDGIINVIDIVQIVNIILGNYMPSDDEFFASDFNQDGLVNVIDIVQIVDIILEN